MVVMLDQGYHLLRSISGALEPSGMHYEDGLSPCRRWNRILWGEENLNTGTY